VSQSCVCDEAVVDELFVLVSSLSVHTFSLSLVAEVVFHPAWEIPLLKKLGRKKKKRNVFTEEENLYAW
jgi:hypothetical protein